MLFLGRLSSYRYYKMDQVVGQPLAAARRLVPQLKVAAELSAR